MPILREPPCTIKGAKEVLKKINKRSKIPIKLAIDTGHQCTIGAKGEDNDVYAWLRALASESPVIHIQQTDGKGDRHWPFTKEYNEVGIIEPDKVIRAIDESGAKEVYLMLEIIHAFEESEERVLSDLRESFRYWSNII
jgi:sugar phosphate isomerase/epimerase